MIPEYKLYHGAVLAELIDEFPGSVTIEEWPEKGRISSYVLNGRVGLHVKHSSSRMRPWMFTVTPANFEDLEQLRQRCDQLFVVLICWLDGMVCINDTEFQAIISEQPGRTWLRAERKRRELYTVSGAQGELQGRRANGITPILQALGHTAAPRPEARTPELPRSSSSWLRRLLGRWSVSTGG
jgi:hypothetical protein